MDAKHTEAMMGHLVDLVEACKAALDDGWQPMSDVPEMIKEVIEDLIPAIGDAKAIPDEYKQDPVQVWKAAAAGMAELVGALISKG